MSHRLAATPERRRLLFGVTILLAMLGAGAAVAVVVGGGGSDRSLSATRPRSRAPLAARAATPKIHLAAPKVLPVTESVRGLQRRLGVVADGDFGPITRRAVEDFQASHGLVVDGIVGPATRAALGLGPGPILRANPI